MTPGQRDYEASLRQRPTYVDGSPRPVWAELGAITRWLIEVALPSQPSGARPADLEG